LLDQADGYRRTRNFANAAQLVDQALALDPKNLRALAYGADLAANAGRKDLALDLIKESLKLAPDAPTVIHDAALIFWRCGQRQRAGRLWERLNEMQPRSAETLWNLAVYHANQDDLETAEKYFCQVREVAPKHQALYLKLGNIAKDSGRIQEALACYRENDRLFPQEIPN
jgi:protein O-GlcNAc transferase